MMYSDFHYRPPPPSYQASMQEYRLRLLLLDRHNATGGSSGPGLSNAAAPPLPGGLAPNVNSPEAALSNHNAAAEAISPPPLYRAQLR